MASEDQTMASKADGHLEIVRNQFNRQAEAYVAVPIVTDPAFLSYIVSISGVSKSDRVIDIASGPGFIAMAFAPHCREVIGIDATDRFVARASADAARRRLDNVSFTLGDVERMSFADASFDIAVCRFAFHHFPRPASVLAEMRRVVRTGGAVVIVDMVASEDAAKAEYHNRLERLCDPSHARAIPASEFERMFADQNFALTHKQTVKSSYSIDEWIAHGAPAAAEAAQIRALMRASIEEDRSGLDVRMVNGVIHFSHTGASYVMRKR
ncbi:MAG TPA: class I SAM-dependent methyltransferase [Candidatus Binataceae bacterium]|nr:class I SAM-dependent methyltransferase [Candidatus Binataceae bacterium]